VSRCAQASVPRFRLYLGALRGVPAASAVQVVTIDDLRISLDHATTTQTRQVTGALVARCR
jgi:hypothetical protein